MNQHGVALAADSAVTLSGGEQNIKIFTSANKIFTASKYEPVGVMIYGNASLMRMPWETLVKVFRSELGETSFEELPSYASYFLDWLRENSGATPTAEQSFVRSTAGGFVHFVRGKFEERVSAHVEEHGEIELKDSKKLLSETLKEMREWTSQAPARDLPEGFEAQLLEEFADLINEVIAAVFEEFPLTRTMTQRLRELAVAPVVRVLKRGDTGIVFAGFGTKDLLPRLREFHIDGVLLGQVIVHSGRDVDVSTEEQAEAYISGFAQDEMIRLFMEGVLPTYQVFVEGYLEAVIDSYGSTLLQSFGGEAPKGLAEALDALKTDLADSFSNDLSSRRYDESIEPVLDIVASLPKDELAALAESLVNLTSLKKRISRDDETVGGPVDVAVISKGDGMIWIKRKHYFAAGPNPHFFANYFRHPPRTEDDDGPGQQ